MLPDTNIISCGVNRAQDCGFVDGNNKVNTSIIST